jgi:hypothetical protein
VMLWPLPLWARWTLSAIGFAALWAALWAATRPGSSSPSPSELRAAAEAERIARLLQADQAPRERALGAGLHPAQALERAIGHDVRARIQRGDLTGRLESVRCRPRSGAAPRRWLRCTAQVSGFDYMFVGVVDSRAKRVTWCKRNPAPTPAQEVALSPACRR